MKIRSLGIVAALVAGTIAAGAGAASAHTPDISASCQGVVLKASSYDGGKANSWTVTVGGQTQSGTFGESLSKTVPVPQEGRSTSWSATIKAEDGSYAQSKSGKVGPCGEKPVKPEKTVDVSKTDAVNCEAKTHDYFKTVTTTTYSFDQNSWTWVPNVVVDGPTLIKSEPITEREAKQCGLKPENKIEFTEWVAGDHTCLDTEYVETRSKSVTRYEWNPETLTFVAQEPVVTTQERTVDNEDFCEQPPAIVSETSSSAQKCGDSYATVTTVTKTIAYVYDPEGDRYVMAQPVISESKKQVPAERVDCPVPPKDDKPDVPASADRVLPDTGAPVGAQFGMAMGGVLVAGGFGVLMAASRRKRV